MYKSGDIVITKKNHPCGSNRWKILRTGIDFKLECEGCKHIILVSKSALDKMVKKIISTENNVDG